jgi:hypothetical protein
MKPEALDVAKSVVSLHREITEKMQKLKQVISMTKNMEELADIGLCLKDSQSYLDDLKSDNFKLLEVVNKVIGALWVQAGVDEPIRTDCVTASPKLQICATVPSRHKQPEEYAALMQHFGVAEEYWNTPKGTPPAIQIYWPGFVEYTSMLAEQAKPLPPGIDPSKTYSVYNVTYRATRDFSNLVGGVEELPKFEF